MGPAFPRTYVGKHCLGLAAIPRAAGRSLHVLLFSVSGGVETLRSRRGGKAEEDLVQDRGPGEHLVCGARLKGCPHC